MKQTSNGVKKLIVANWKMQLTTKEAVKLAKRIGDLSSAAALVLCPSFTALASLAALGKSNYELGAQDVFWEEAGAYTGEVSPRDLKELGAKFVIIGHSERRQFLGETDEMVSRKVKTALADSLVPILCVGETEPERAAGEQKTVVERQMRAVLGRLGNLSKTRLVIAYEPVWAIGTGRTPQPAEIQEMHQLIFSLVSQWPGGQNCRLQVIYGGSVNADNILDFLSLPEVDGSLVGGASSDFKKFRELLKVLNHQP